LVTAPPVVLKLTVNVTTLLALAGLGDWEIAVMNWRSSAADTNMLENRKMIPSENSVLIFITFTPSVTGLREC
jgi:type IV secretory pathway VirJ component